MMLRSKPKLSYSGLTIILSNPSRHDKVALLTGDGGYWFNKECLRPELNQMQCDVRVMEDNSSFLPNTKCILLVGEAAMHKFVIDSRANTLNELRGSPLNVNGISAIATYNPQDAVDLKPFEKMYNELSKEYTEDEDFSDDDDEGDVKALSPTKRSNYAFWVRADVRKCKEILLSKLESRTNIRPTYKIFPPADEVIEVLTKTKGQTMWFDIETDYEEQNLLCFSFSFNSNPCVVYSVPVLDFNYISSYSSIHSILRSLCVAIRDNIAVAHNGHAFDFFVLATKYRIPINRTYDTMLAMHRCFPDIEKSLGHCVSYWTWERFHKDTDSRAYTTRQHMMDKLLYCAKDVYTMSLVHQAIEAYAKTKPGLQESIQCAMDSIKPYLITTIQGISYNQQKVNEIMNENDRLMTQYDRIIKLLIGVEATIECQRAVKGKAKFFAGSNKQCVNYFHEQLEYPVIARTPSGAPSLGKKALYRLALKNPENSVIMWTLMYREIQKEYGSLTFNPWKDDANQIIKQSSGDTEETFGGFGTSLSKM